MRVPYKIQNHFSSKHKQSTDLSNRAIVGHFNQIWELFYFKKKHQLTNIHKQALYASVQPHVCTQAHTIFAQTRCNSSDSHTINVLSCPFTN